MLKVQGNALREQNRIGRGQAGTGRFGKFKLGRARTIARGSPEPDYHQQSHIKMLKTQVPHQSSNSSSSSSHFFNVEIPQLNSLQQKGQRPSSGSKREVMNSTQGKLAVGVLKIAEKLQNNRFKSSAHVSKNSVSGPLRPIKSKQESRKPIFTNCFGSHADSFHRSFRQKTPGVIGAAATQVNFAKKNQFNTEQTYREMNPTQEEEHMKAVLEGTQHRSNFTTVTSASNIYRRKNMKALGQQVQRHNFTITNYPDSHLDSIFSSNIHGTISMNKVFGSGPSDPSSKGDNIELVDEAESPEKPDKLMIRNRLMNQKRSLLAQRAIMTPGSSITSGAVEFSKMEQEEKKKEVVAEDTLWRLQQNSKPVEIGSFQVYQGKRDNNYASHKLVSSPLLDTENSITLRLDQTKIVEEESKLFQSQSQSREVEQPERNPFIVLQNKSTSAQSRLFSDERSQFRKRSQTSQSIGSRRAIAAARAKMPSAGSVLSFTQGQWMCKDRIREDLQLHKRIQNTYYENIELNHMTRVNQAPRLPTKINQKSGELASLFQIRKNSRPKKPNTCLEYYPEVVKHEISGKSLSVNEQNLNFFAKTNKLFSEKRAAIRSIERKVAFAKLDPEEGEEQPAPAQPEDSEMEDHNIITQLLQVEKQQSSANLGEASLTQIATTTVVRSLARAASKGPVSESISSQDSDVSTPSSQGSFYSKSDQNSAREKISQKGITKAQSVTRSETVNKIKKINTITEIKKNQANVPKMARLGDESLVLDLPQSEQWLSPKITERAMIARTKNQQYSICKENTADKRSLQSQPSQFSSARHKRKLGNSVGSEDEKRKKMQKKQRAKERKKEQKRKEKQEEKKQKKKKKIAPKINITAIKQELQNHIVNNMKLAEEHGVFNALREVNDFEDPEKKQLSWMEQRRKKWRQNEKKRKEMEKLRNNYNQKVKATFKVVKTGKDDLLSNTMDSMSSESDEAFVSHSHSSAEEIKEESGQIDALDYARRSGSQNELENIFKKFQQQGLDDFSEQMLNQLIVKDQIMAFLAEIRAQHVKHDDGALTEHEEALAKYVKYLMGESRNEFFQLRREDFSQRHELNKKSLRMPYEEYVREEENSMKTVANDIIERCDYNEVMKNYSKPMAASQFQTNPKYAFFQICQDEADSALPLFAKVTNRQLSLMNYQISIGHVRALTRTFDFNQEFINRFLFKNCGLTDEHIETLLIGARKLEQVQALVFKNEEFGQKSVEAIQPLILRPKPNSLQVLRIIDCQIPAQITRQLIKNLRECNHIKVLGLVKAAISDVSMQDLGALVAESKWLSELDISWNELKPQSYNALIASLGKNKTLLTLNLSWNRIVDSQETIIEQNSDINQAASSTIDSRKTSVATGEWFENEARFTEFSQKVIDNLTHLFKHNKKLQHVNLTNTGLTEFMILQIGASLRRAKSLVSIHLCSNPGSTPRAKDYLAQRIRCAPDEPPVKFNVGEIIERLTQTQRKQTLIRQINESQELFGENCIARQTIKIRQNMERKRVYSLVNDFIEDQDLDARMIFQRNLGHKQDMPGSGQWRLIKDKNEECWICDQQVYGLVFWDDKTIARQAIAATRDPKTERYMRKVIDELHEVTSKEEEEKVAHDNPTSPIIMGDFTNWKPKPMLEITAFTESLDEQYDADYIISIMQTDKVLSYRKSSQSQFNDMEQIQFKKYTAEYFEHHAAQNWKMTLAKHLLYKKPHVVYGANTRKDFYKSLFMLATMFKVGKHEFIVRYPKQAYNHKTAEYFANFGDDDSVISSCEPDYAYFTNVSDIRVENPHPFVKDFSTKVNVRRFDRETSVFAQWKPDDKWSIAATFLCDFENTKISRVIKDPTDLQKTKDFLKANYEFIKEQYIELQYNSVYPFVNKIQTAEFCDTIQVIGDNLNTSHCDLIYVSSYSQTKGGIKGKRGMIRSEFLEYLVRLAGFKFIDSQQVPTYNEAIRRIIDEHMKPNLPPMQWQQFRDDELWCMEVNDVFDANMDGIMKLYKHYFTEIQKFMSDKDAIQLLSKDAKDGKLTFQQAKFCLSYCKMTIKDEIAEFDKYRRVQPVELLELIGRAAKIKYIGTEHEEEPLHRKIELFLDQLFLIVKFQRRPVTREDFSDEESDDDY